MTQPNAPQRKPLTPAELEHVHYEWRMLLQLEERLRSPTGDTVVDNALVESFLVHARILYEFLEWSAPPAAWDDIKAPVQPPPTPAAPKTNRRAIDKRVVHLSRTRVGPMYKWPTLDIAIELSTALAIFVDTKIGNGPQCDAAHTSLRLFAAKYNAPSVATGMPKP